MKGQTISFLFLVMIVVVLPINLCAQSMPDELFLEFDFEGMGNMILASPPVYSGDITAGDPLVTGGTWWVRIDDTDWPPVTDPETRWNYIFTNYFTYNPMTGSWTAHFDATTLPEKPTWEIQHPVNGTMGGTLVISFTYGDWDVDGVLDLEERMFGTYEGTLMVMKYGTGNFAIYCGDGAYNGSCQNGDPANFMDDFVEGHCVMDLVNCQIGNENASWGFVKSLLE
ncbi:MAG: hypothetical protein MUF59_07335 [Candidatus Krumholzibacteria bacterium]|jgi:hypothetical protein|nr:hypothetical protein [Candidatus Krumholzibacteria bacterium]